ncbi:hypothetical protein DM02DRAFT_706493 [Periconia macrospinosa]|uniref:Uncharacterized protein n=1 Tax=Periconia macrospinosa TaxID=97972 RepID=A0A2V1DUY3_9PLEO|nr:hypothetical protein DM02DRAFT_706493 [Periconia macrospinosa]
MHSSSIEGRRSKSLRDPVFTLGVATLAHDIVFAPRSTPEDLGPPQCYLEWKNLMHLGDHDSQTRLGDAFNYIEQELETFPFALNGKRAQAGVAEMIEIRKLWLEFVRSLFETMVTRTHSWVLDRVNEIVDNAKADYDAVVDAHGVPNARDAAKELLEAW